MHTGGESNQVELRLNHGRFPIHEEAPSTIPIGSPDPRSYLSVSTLTLTLDSQTIDRAARITAAELAQLPADARHIVRAVAQAARACSECQRDYGHTVDCSQHYTKRPTTTDCPGCIHGDFGPFSNHSCSRWKRVDL